MVNFRDSYFPVQWDITKKHLSGSFWGKQYDTGRGFTVTVINGGQVVSPTNEVLRLKWEKPDNTAGYVQATIINGKFVIENIDQMFTVAGSVRADLELSVGGEFVASITFYVNVEKAVAVGAVESSSEFTALQTAIGTVDGLDAEMYSLQTDFNSLETQFNNVIANVTVDSEVISARGTEATLGARLDLKADKTDFDILESTKADKYYGNGGTKDEAGSTSPYGGGFMRIDKSPFTHTGILKSVEFNASVADAVKIKFFQLIDNVLYFKGEFPLTASSGTKKYISGVDFTEITVEKGWLIGYRSANTNFTIKIINTPGVVSSYAFAGDVVADIPNASAGGNNYHMAIYGEVAVDIESDIEEIKSKIDSGVSDVSKLSKGIEVLNSDPTGTDLYEGRMWILNEALGIDQQNPSTGVVGLSISGVSTGWSRKTAVSFVPSVTKPVDKVVTYGRYRDDLNAGRSVDVKITIQTDNVGSPSGTLVDPNYSTTITGDNNAVSHPITADYSSDVPLTAGTKYWIVIETVGTTSEVYFSFEYSTGIYTGETKYIQKGGTWTAAADDLCFVEYVI